MAEIVLDGVTKRFSDGTVAVREFDLTIADGEFVILVGPSGCGKSTTLNMIAGLEDITDGELRIGGERVNERAPKDRDIAMVFQSYALYPHMTVRQNIGFPLRLAGTDKARANAKIEETAGILDLSDLLDRRPANLSGGQRQRVAMGRAIVRDPSAFLMDEPLSNLDARLRVQMRTMISRLQNRLGTTTVYVTHDQTEAMTLGDRIVLMKDGVVQQTGAPEDLYARPHNLFVAGFIGSPAMNLLPAELTSEGLRTPLGLVPPTPRITAALRSDPPREVVMGLRPEAFADTRLPRPVADGAARLAFTARTDIVESLGAEKYVYLDLSPEPPGAPAPGQLVARLDAASPVREGEPLELDYDPTQIHLFHPETGVNLTESR
ncbi:ABC transporter ATP-binding protein [Actinocorallia populi]|uniref:ABC transporter ATP-binding protein n=1 Tax=Actinocorallia populi TaxID=2079200 RepID=UPI000D08EFB5|nr:sn-glycerol-3-phosphate ABC transporter ATP-binding protein UgpC [Actinocorallia populi]